MNYLEYLSLFIIISIHLIIFKNLVQNRNLFIFNRNYVIGLNSSLFLIFYGFFRIFSELFREPDIQVGYLFNLFSMGSILSFIMILAGMIIFVFIKKR